MYLDSLPSSGHASMQAPSYTEENTRRVIYMKGWTDDELGIICVSLDAMLRK